MPLCPRTEAPGRWARQPLFDQIAQVLVPLGMAVLSYDRRPADGGDTPLGVQASDAVAAMRALKRELRCPVGVFGFSQGAWRTSGADVTLVDLPGCGHWPVAGSEAPGYAGVETDTLSAAFTASMAGWLNDVLRAPADTNLTSPE